MSLLDAFLGPKCADCGERIKGTKISLPPASWLCQPCKNARDVAEQTRIREEQKRREEEEDQKAAAQDQDKRKEFGEKITEPWSGLTCNFFGIRLLNRRAAIDAFQLFTSRAPSAPTKVAVIRGVLNVRGQTTPIVGIICAYRDSDSHAVWLSGAINSTRNTADNEIMQMSDKGPYEFGFENSPLVVHEYALFRFPS